MLRLHVLAGVDKGQVIVCREGAVGIGSDPENEVTLSDPFVSHRHGQIALVDGNWRYRDLGSTNGSMIERGESHLPLARVEPEIELESGDLTRYPKTHLAARMLVQPLVLFSPLVHTPGLRAAKHGEGRRTRTGLGGDEPALDQPPAPVSGKAITDPRAQSVPSARRPPRSGRP